MHGTDDRVAGASIAASNAKRVWQTPEIITSDARGASAQVTFGSDGSTPVYGPYGS